MNDINLFEKKNKTGSFKWKYLIIDEGHRLKNKASILYSVLGALDTKRRLLLTGTPVQNNLDELWNLFSFILPDIFNHLSHYNDWFNKPFNVDVDKNDDDSDEDYLIGKKRKNASGDLKDKGFKINNTFNEDEKKIIISSLHRVIKPFILRRKKEDVAVDGCIYPSLTRIREVSAAVAIAVCEDAYALGVARLPRPENLEAHVFSCMWSPNE
jgi:SNF2 family DNA or RNA helicase